MLPSNIKVREVRSVAGRKLKPGSLVVLVLTLNQTSFSWRSRQLVPSHNTNPMLSTIGIKDEIPIDDGGLQAGHLGEAGKLGQSTGF